MKKKKCCALEFIIFPVSVLKGSRLHRIGWMTSASIQVRNKSLSSKVSLLGIDPVPIYMYIYLRSECSPMKYCWNGCHFYHTDYMSLYNPLVSQVSQEQQLVCAVACTIIMALFLCVSYNSELHFSLVPLCSPSTSSVPYQLHFYTNALCMSVTAASPGHIYKLQSAGFLRTTVYVRSSYNIYVL